MAEEHKKCQNGGETVSTGCGMFDFLKKKENENRNSKEEAYHSPIESSSVIIRYFSHFEFLMLHHMAL